MSQDFIDPEISADFVIEAKEHLETIEPALLELEKEPDNLKLLDVIFRPMHSLKGASGFLGFNRMNRLAHKGENVLDELRKGNMRVNVEIMDLILRTTDTLKEMVESLESSGSEGDADIDDLIGLLDALLKGTAGGGAATPAAAEKPDAASLAQELPPYDLTLASEEHLSDFLEEARDVIGALNQGMIAAEKNPGDTELINDLFRYFHNLKGNSGIIGYVELNELTHEAESFLNGVRKGEYPLTRGAVDLLLTVIDGLEELVRRIDPAGHVTPVSMTHLASALRDFHVEAGGQPAAVPEPPAAPVQTVPGVDAEDVVLFEQAVEQQFSNIHMALAELGRDAGRHEYIDSLFRSFSSLQNSASYMTFGDLSIYAERTANLVAQARDSGLDFSLMLDMLSQEAAILEDMTAKALKSVQCAPGDSSDPASVPPVPPEPDAEVKTSQPARPDESAGAGAESGSAGNAAQDGTAAGDAPVRQSAGAPSRDKAPKSSSTIRVDHAKLDHLMNLIGELIINRNRFSMLAKALEEGSDPHTIAQHLTETTYSMNRISDDLQDTIMHVRMVPVQTVFSKFPRLIRDLSRKSGKKVELITEGEETELDKSVVEVIGDPLVHLLRNSMDHGLEDAEGRAAAGKPETGRVWLRAFHKGNSVMIEVEDDGRGIDPDVMRRKGVEKGLITPEDAKNMDDRAARELIFAAGFSTAAKITDISGRGVGMDVVRNNIKELKGSVQVQSEVGKGTKFILSLPLTLAIIDALMVRVGENTYAIPLDAVSETTKIPAAKISEINHRKATTLRGDVVGLAELGGLLDHPSDMHEVDPLPVVIISVNDRRLGLIVDQLLQRQDVVIKSMGDYLGEIHGVSGATILGDGRVILILDPHELYRLAMARNIS